MTLMVSKGYNGKKDEWVESPLRNHFCTHRNFHYKFFKIHKIYIVERMQMKSMNAGKTTHELL